MKKRMVYHNPVLLKEAVDALNIKEDGVYVDVTFGGGGHSREILKRLGDKGKLIVFDQDKDAIANKLEDDRFIFIAENFRYVKRYLRFYGVKKVDGILADFGVSSHQFDVPDRGFSIRFDALLDMRMNKENPLTAFDVVNEYTETQLKEIFWNYGELKNATKIASLLVEKRKENSIDTTTKLSKCLTRLLPQNNPNKILAKIYQAIRIEVNQEITVIKEFLLQTPEILNEKGRLSLISYHSLEDRLVKNFIRSGNFGGVVEKDFYGNPIISLKKIGKLIVPSKEEIVVNNRARSAKLRIAEKL